MKIEIGSAAIVDKIAQILIGLIWSTKLHSIGLCQDTVQPSTGTGTGEHTDLEGIAFFMLCNSSLGYCRRYYLRVACRGKTAKADIVVVMHKLRCFFCSDKS